MGPRDVARRAAGSTWTHGLAVSGSSASDVWIFGHVGKGVASVSHYDGAVWTPAAVPAIDAALSAAIYVASPTEAWIAHGMSILKWDGSAWSIAHSAATELLDIAGSSESDVWAVGRDGLAVHWDGTSWSETTTGVAITLTQVASAGPTRAWAAGGRGGTILEWNGTAWTPKVGLSRESISVLTYADKLWGMTSGGGIFYAR